MPHLIIDTDGDAGRPQQQQQQQRHHKTQHQPDARPATSAAPQQEQQQKNKKRRGNTHRRSASASTITTSSMSTSSVSTTASDDVSAYETCKQSIVRKSYDFIENDLECVIDQSPFLQQQRGPSAAAMHAGLFHRSEIRTGRQLGKGGFSVVYEIVEFRLHRAIQKQLSEEQQHARLSMRQSCIDPVTGEPRYAIKHLQETLLKDCHTRPAAATREFMYAASDLAVEALFMSNLSHPNILPIRGLPVQGLHALMEGQYDGYFIVTDRLHDTLDARIQRAWSPEAAANTTTAAQQQRDRQQQQQQQQCCEDQRDEFDDVESFYSEHKSATEPYADVEEEAQATTTTNNNNALHVMLEKLEIGSQLASALDYLHDNRICYRDMKPHNIGITRDGTLQLFDFGLCRELPAPLDADNPQSHLTELYQMSGVGTRRYMAVEVVNDGQYNTLADVYSWSMVMYEMLAGEKPFPSLTVEDHRVRVCQQGERPPIDASWPVPIQLMLQHAWTESLAERLSIKEVRQYTSKIMTDLQRTRRTQQMIDYQGSYDTDIQQQSLPIEKYEAPDSPNGVADDDLFFVQQQEEGEYQQQHQVKSQDWTNGDLCPAEQAGNNNNNDDLDFLLALPSRTATNDNEEEVPVTITFQPSMSMSSTIDLHPSRAIEVSDDDDDRETEHDTDGDRIFRGDEDAMSPTRETDDCESDGSFRLLGMSCASPETRRLLQGYCGNCGRQSPASERFSDGTEEQNRDKSEEGLEVVVLDEEFIEPAQTNATSKLWNYYKRFPRLLAVPTNQSSY